MVSYELVFLLLISKLQSMQPKDTQPWYADDAGASGTLTRLQAHTKGVFCGSYQ